jgi:hypothetical protein
MTVEQLLRVIMNDQGYLYALIKQMQAGDSVVTPEQFEAWQDEWAVNTREILQELEGEEQSNE